MPQKPKSAILFGLCSALAACDSAPNRDLTAPQEGGSGTFDAQSVRLVAPNTWTTKRSMLFARLQAKAGVINNVIYVVGGRSSFSVGPSATVQAYSVLSNNWSTRRPLPIPLFNHNGASVINGRLYVAGGQNNSGMSKRLYEYTPATDTWMRKADMPLGGSCGAQGVIGGLLYVYISCTNIPDAHRFFRYNRATNTWAGRALPPVAYNFPAVGVIGGKLYLAGGHDQRGVAQLALNVYNPATNTWTTKAPMPGAQIDPASAVINGKLFIAGGRDENGATGKLTVYDPATDTWATKTPMPTARFSAVGAAASGFLFVFGGTAGGGVANRKAEAYTP